MDAARRRHEAPIVGRDDVRRRLVAALTGDGRGSGAAVLLGPSGIGKTQLARAVVDDLGARALWGTCFPMATLNVPFLPLRTMFGERHTDVAIDFDGAPGPVLTSIERWIDLRTRDGRLVIILDDAQWADPSTLDTLLFLMSGPRDRALSVLVTVRPGTAELTDEGRRWLANARHMPGCEVVELGPLDRAETGDQLAALLGVHAHETLIEDVWRHSRGYPYLTALLVEGLHPDTRRLPGQLPDRLVRAVLEHVSRVEPGALDFMRVLALAARPLGADEARAIVGVWRRTGDAATSIDDDCVASAVDSGVLVSVDARRFWFAHPLMAEALAAEIPAEDRHEIHRAFLRAARESSPPVEEMIRLADHAAGADEPEVEYRWALRAQERAARGGAFDIAAALAQRCLMLRRRLSQVPHSERELLERHLDAVKRVGPAVDELSSLDRMLELTPPDDARGRSELTVRRLLVRVGGQLADPTPAELHDLVELTASQPCSAERAHALAFVTLWEPQADAAMERAAAAEAALAGGRTDLAEAWTVLAHMHAASLAGDGPAVLARVSRAAELAIAAGDGIAYNMSIQLAAPMYGDPSESYARALQRHRLAGEGRIGQAHLSWAALGEAETWFELGEWRETDAALRAATRTYPNIAVDARARAIAGRLAVRRGDATAAAMHFARTAQLAEESEMVPPIDLVMGRVEQLLDRGDLEEAAAVMGDSLLRFRSLVERAELAPYAFRILADTRKAAVGNQAEERVVARLDAFLTPAATTVPSLVSLEAVHLTLAAALSRAESARWNGDADECDHWTALRDTTLARGLRWEAAYACLRAAEAMLSEGRGDRARAAPIVREGLNIAVILGARPLEVRLRDLARFARIPVPGSVASGHRPSPSIDGLTPREIEIVRLVVAGRTYREIAGELFVSEKTVSSHISNVLRKTGAANRIDLARRAAAVMPPS